MSMTKQTDVSLCRGTLFSSSLRSRRASVLPESQRSLEITNVLKANY
jgi:hypothetical protein